MRLPIILAAGLAIAGCSQAQPEGWPTVEELKADLGGTTAFGEPRFLPAPRVTVAAPLSCATAFDPRDSYAALRDQAEEVDGIGLNDRTFALADFPAAFPGHSGPAVAQRVQSTWVIFIARDISAEEKRAALLHELDHILCGLRH